MAKKVRTPPPPRRPVQAPQRRETKRQKGAPERSSRLLWLVAVLALVAAAAIGSALYFALRGNGGTGKNTSNTPNYNTLPGVRKIKAPWPVEYANLDERLAPLNLQELQREQLAYHIHQHLDIFLNGKRIEVPQCIGILRCYQHFVYLTQLHTHDPSGVIHVESLTNHHYSLGTVFAEWGVYLDSKCVGAYCQGYSWYVNGQKQTGNPADHELLPHQEIVIAIGKPPKKIPKTYNWTGL